MNFFLKKISLCFCVFTAIFFFSCSKKSITIPDNVLSKKEIVPVLVDIHLAQAAANRNQFSDTVHNSLSDYTPFIFQSHRITKQKYDSSISFYTKYPELMDEIYQDVINELSKKQSEAQKK